MKKRILNTLLLALALVIIILPAKAKAGHDLGTLTKDNPCVFYQFSIKDVNDYYGGFFSIKNNAKSVKMTLENLTGSNGSVKVKFYDISGDKFELVKTLTLKKGKKKATFNLPDFKNGEQYFMELFKPNLGDKKELQLGLSVYSQSLGGERHDFKKVALSNKELEVSNSKSVTLKVTLDKSIKKEGVVWSSSNPKVAKISKKGKITFVANGYAVITCTSKKNPKYSDRCELYVNIPGLKEASDYYDPDVEKSGDISEIEVSHTMTEIWEGADMWPSTDCHRYLTIKTNGYSGELVLIFKCADEDDKIAITVEKNKTYNIDYAYRVTAHHSFPTTISTKYFVVEIEGLNTYTCSLMTPDTYNKGSLSMNEE